MKRFPILAALLLCGCSLFHSPPAAASTLVVTLTYPTQDVENVVIPDTGISSLASVRVEYGTCKADGVTFDVKAGEFSRARVAGQAMPATVTNNIAAGLACVRAYVTNAGGVESGVSNTQAKLFAPAAPKPPVITSLSQT